MRGKIRREFDMLNTALLQQTSARFALGRAGHDVELVTSHFRFAESSYPADGYTRSEVFYPFSSKVFRRSKMRIPVGPTNTFPPCRSWLTSSRAERSTVR